MTQSINSRSEPPLLLSIDRFPTAFLGRGRGIHICLPPQYQAGASRRYPVLYLHDGQNLFDDNLSYSGTSWNLHNIVHDLINTDQIEALILIAIDHGGEQRLSEFSHCDRVFDGKTIAGRAHLYERFLVEELKPWIDRYFPTSAGTEDTALMGSSMGGLMSLRMALRFPRIFGKVAALSPSLWWDESFLETMAEQNFLVPEKLRLWIDYGGREGYFGEAIPYFCEQLKKVTGRKSNLCCYSDPQADHSEAAWRARVHLPLKYLFGTHFHATVDRAAVP